jgi:hypothetical protein
MFGLEKGRAENFQMMIFCSLFCCCLYYDVYDIERQPKRCIFVVRTRVCGCSAQKQFFGLKILKFFDADPDPESF